MLMVFTLSKWLISCSIGSKSWVMGQDTPKSSYGLHKSSMTKCDYAIFWHKTTFCNIMLTRPPKYLVVCINLKLFSQRMLLTWRFPSFFQGYEGSLIKLTSKQVRRRPECFYTNRLMRGGVSHSLTIRSLLPLLKLSLINTWNFFISPLTYFFPPLLMMKD